ncbi:lipid II flippase MurJ [Actinoplanes sp. NPDC049681]|uniref:lipid II flippase MurJ n=1 Tax=Actinoplanes sp. NPDC049681 TaxID=3363905 RepID=UPI0037B6D2CE
MTATADRSPVRTTLVRAALVTIVVTMAGSLLGLVRDLLLARFFGADGGTDAFLVAWTVPETAFVLVVEGAMSLLMIPVFSRALTRATERDAVRATRAVLSTTLPPVIAVLVVSSAAVALGAPVLVRVVAPGLADPQLAITCTRLTAVTVLTFGIAGYLSAALRANHVFGAPAAIHLAYNVGIVALMATLHGRLGVVSAAAGVALGSVFMVLVQVPSFLRHVGLPRRWRFTGSPVMLGVVAPIVAYTVARQAQVFVERYLGSSLAPGTISYLNYAQKVAQIPMLIALLVCTVTFPTLARSVAAGELEQARRRVETDLRTVTALIFLATAYLIAFAPQVVAVLLEHGRFTAADTAATASVMRVYALGVFGHAMVGVLSRPFFTGERRTWYPAAAMAAGLALTAAVAAAAVPFLGAYAIAAANGIGITTTAVLLLLGLRARIIAVSVRAVGASAAKLAAAATVAGTAGWLTGRALAAWPPLPTAVVGGLVVLGVFAALARLTGLDEAWKGRIPHGS